MFHVDIVMLRKAQGLTQKELAIRVGCSFKTVWRLENQQCDPRLSVLTALAKVLEVETAVLLRPGAYTEEQAP
jgi:transcriptional regulator with XRE-family HTH domain